MRNEERHMLWSIVGALLVCVFVLGFHLSALGERVVKLEEATWLQD